MTQLDRRRVLTSLAGGVAAMSAAPGISKAASAVSDSDLLDERVQRRGWLIAQQDSRERGRQAVNFWSMNWAPNHFANHLPPAISRGLIAYHDFGARNDDADAEVDPLERAFENCARKWIEPKQLDRFTLKLDVGANAFPPRLIAFVGESETAPRIALIDLDSRTIFGGEMTHWWHILPAFRRCYDSIIGVCHVEQRGLRQERAYFNRIFDESHFLKNILEPASLCDAAIVTSAGLIETDHGLSLSDSTETLVGEVVRRLGYALMDRKVLDQIVGPRRTTQNPRFFALGSATVNAPSPLSGLQSILCRQSAFVSASFGPLVGLPIPIVSAREYGPDLPMPTEIINVFSRMHGYPIEPITMDEVQAPYYQANARDWPGAIDLIALWPFEVDRGGPTS